ncbi:MAG: hypothetical protein IIA88_07590 [Bacteroidetes bacterium]|nr:hypothetical protein [Bacteroidota bacterium]
MKKIIQQSKFTQEINIQFKVFKSVVWAVVIIGLLAVIFCGIIWFIVRMILPYV